MSVFTIGDGKCPNVDDLANAGECIDDLVIAQDWINIYLFNIHVMKALGPDGIPNIFLKRFSEWCAKYLNLVLYKSLNTSPIPKKWKTAIIIPVLKSGDNAIV